MSVALFEAASFDYIYLFSIPLLLVIAYQDFTRFEITAFLFPLLLVFYGLLLFVSSSLEESLNRILWNSAFVGFLLAGVFLWFKLTKRGEKILDEKMGMGDIFFFIAAIPIFNIFNYVLFLTLSFAMSILYSICCMILQKGGHRIPLAGIMGIVLTVFLLYFQK